MKLIYTIILSLTFLASASFAGNAPPEFKSVKAVRSYLVKSTDEILKAPQSERLQKMLALGQRCSDATEAYDSSDFPDEVFGYLWACVFVYTSDDHYGIDYSVFTPNKENCDNTQGHMSDMENAVEVPELRWTARLGQKVLVSLGCPAN